MLMRVRVYTGITSIYKPVSLKTTRYYGTCELSLISDEFSIAVLDSTLMWSLGENEQ